MLRDAAQSRLLRARLLAAKVLRLLGERDPRSPEDADPTAGGQEAQAAPGWAQKKRDVVRKRIRKSQGSFCRLLTRHTLPDLRLPRLFAAGPACPGPENPFHAARSSEESPRSRGAKTPTSELAERQEWTARSPCFGVRRDSSEHSEEMPLVTAQDKLDMSIEKRAFQPIENTIKHSDLKQADDKADLPTPLKVAWQQHPGNFKPRNFEAKTTLPHTNN